MRNLLTSTVLGSAVLLGCQAGPDQVIPGEGEGRYRYIIGVDGDSAAVHYGGAHEILVFDDRGKAEAIDAANQPSRLHNALRKPEYLQYDAALDRGETTWDVFASQWWAQKENGIAKRWTGGSTDLSEHGDRDRLSPIEKYDVLFYDGDPIEVGEVAHWNMSERRLPEDERPEKHSHPAVSVVGPATAWEIQNHGLYQDYAHPDSWWGHCNGWASYATTEKLGYPTRDIRVKIVDGEVTECVGELDGDEDCLLVRMGDIEALMTELYFSDQATFSGRRCNTNPDEIERDEFGRAVDPACRDLNAGSFHVGITGLLNRGANHLGSGEDAKPAFIIDHNYDWEVWNFPLTRYVIDLQEEITAEEANELVGATGSDYEFNARAVKFVKVHMRYWMVSDGVPFDKMQLPANERGVEPHETELRYVLELANDGEILGGEWLKVPSTEWWNNGELKEIHPDFYWMGVKANGWGESDDDLGGDDDNPHVAYSKVAALLECANDATSCAPGAVEPEPTEGYCVGHCGGSSTESGETCWCDDLCTAYGDCCSDYEPVCR